MAFVLITYLKALKFMVQYLSNAESVSCKYFVGSCCQKASGVSSEIVVLGHVST